MPTTVLYFLRQVKAELWNGATFHRNAGHVLQAGVGPNRPKLVGLGAIGEYVPIQEYDSSYPHEQYTVGLAGRPGGPDWYISTIDNTRNHGPGSQSVDAKLIGEADPCFGKIVGGVDVVTTMRKLPVRGGGFGLLVDPVVIVSATVA